jgi:hypothetical protein
MFLVEDEHPQEVVFFLGFYPNDRIIFELIGRIYSNFPVIGFSMKRFKTIELSHSYLPDSM